MRDNAKIIPNGIDSTNITYIDKKVKYFLFVGQLEETKGIQIAIEAFIELLKINIWNDYKLLIAGGGGILH